MLKRHMFLLFRWLTRFSLFLFPLGKADPHYPTDSSHACAAIRRNRGVTFRMGQKAACVPERMYKTVSYMRASAHHTKQHSFYRKANRGWTPAYSIAPTLPHQKGIPTLDQVTLGHRTAIRSHSIHQIGGRYSEIPNMDSRGVFFNTSCLAADGRWI
jgi:hypothetical protein